MSATKIRIDRYRDAKKQIRKLSDDDSNVLIIHYSCENFFNDNEGRTPRITSIAVRYLHTGQTKSFSIHKVAEVKKIENSKIVDYYDSLEKEMLKDFYKFLKEHKSYKWIHWNLRDINYGFEAIKHRAKVLGTKAEKLDDKNKYDLSRLLISMYGKGYTDHPRLNSIISMNNISPNNWISGEEEAKAFENKEFVKLHQSTLARVSVFEDILRLTAEGKLKTKSKWNEIYGISPQGVFELSKDKWWCNLLIYFLGILTGVLISNYLK